MRRTELLMLILGLSSVLALIGCRQGDTEPQSELDRFLARYRALPAAEFEDSLRALTQGSPPHSVFAHYELGNYYYGLATDSSAASGWDTDFVAASLDSGQLYFERTIELDSTFVEAYVNLGSLYDDRAAQVTSGFEGRRTRQENLEMAKSLYHKALEINPDDEKAGCNLGAVHLKLRQQTEAIACFNHVLEVNPNSALAHYNLAIMFAEEKIYREAIVEWEAAAAADSEGDIGERSRANIEIVKQLMETDIPENLGQH